MRISPPPAGRRLLRTNGSDDGFSLAESLVALMLITGAVTAMLGMITRSLQTHRAQRDSAVAERLATTMLESARSESFSNLTTLGIPRTTQGAFTAVPKIALCSPNDGANECHTPASGAPVDAHVDVQVSWNEAGQAKHLDLTTGITNLQQGTVAGAGNSTISSLTGGARNGLSVSVSSLAVSPATTSVSSSGHPAQAEIVTATIVGLTSTTSFPVTWSDDTGSHQASMMNTDQGSWSVSIPAASITRSVSLGQQASVVFAATVPGSQAVPTATLTLIPAIPTASCTAPAAITLNPLSARTLLPVNLTCTTGALASTDLVTVSWPTASGTATGRLTTTDGTNWSLTLPANTALRTGVTETFTFAATRVMDNAMVTSSATSALA